MSKSDALRRSVKNITGNDPGRGTLGRLFDAMGKMAGTNAEVEQFYLFDGSLTEINNVKAELLGGDVFSFRFSFKASVTGGLDSLTAHFLVNTEREVPDGFWAMGVGHIHTADGQGKYYPTVVELNESAEGGTRIDCHVLLEQALEAEGDYVFTGYVTGLWK